MCEVWIAKQVLDYHAANVGLVDKPCWKVKGPNGFEGYVWTWANAFHAVSTIAKQAMPRAAVKALGDYTYCVWSRRS